MYTFITGIAPTIRLRPERRLKPATTLNTTGIEQFFATDLLQSDDFTGKVIGNGL